MFVAAYHNTMRNARTNFSEPEKTVDLVALRAQRRKEAEEERRREMARMAELLKEQRRIANEMIELGRQAARRVRRMEAGEVTSVSLRTIERRICRAMGVSRDAVLGPKRSTNLVLARHAILYWGRRLTTMSLPELGRALGGRDHTTALHRIRAYPAKRRAMGRILRALS